MSNGAVATANRVRVIAPRDDSIWDDEQLWQVVSSGNLKGLNPGQKVRYYRHRCEASGLNPATQPYAYMVLDGVEQLYARKTCADQLRQIHGVSVTSVRCTRDDDYIEFEVSVTDREGRQDFDMGVVFVGDMKGAQRANKKKVALTQAKRRATLSLCGEGVLDESEVSEIPGAMTYVSASVVPVAKPVPAKLVLAEDGTSAHIETKDGDIIDADTGEIQPPIDTPVISAETDDDLDGRVKYLRERLGWSAQDVVNDAAENDINLRSSKGMVAMVKRLEVLVRAS